MAETRYWRGWDGNMYVETGRDEDNVYLRNVLTEEVKEVSPRAPGRTFHERWQCPHCHRWLQYDHGFVPDEDCQHCDVKWLNEIRGQLVAHKQVRRTPSSEFVQNRVTEALLYDPAKCSNANKSFYLALYDPDNPAEERWITVEEAKQWWKTADVIHEHIEKLIV